MHDLRRLGRQRWGLRWAGALASLGGAACGLVVTSEEQARRPEPGQALEAFRRDLGIAESTASRPATRAGATRSARAATLDAKTLEAWVRERVEAFDAFRRCRPEDRPLELRDLPTGEGRVERLARARGLLALERGGEAARLMIDLLAAEPRYFPASEMLAAVRLQEGNLAETVVLLREVLQDFDSEEVRLELGRALCLHAGAEERRAGQAEFEMLVRGGTRPVTAARAAAGFYVQWIDAAAIERVLRAGLVRAAEATPDEVVEARLLLARALFWQRKTEESRAELLALRAEPNRAQARALFHLSLVLHDMGRYAEAVAAFEDLERGDFEAFRRSQKEATLGLLGAELRSSAQRGQRAEPIYTELDLRFALRNHPDGEVRRWALERRAAGRGGELREDLWFVLEHDAEPSLRVQALLALLKDDRGDRRPIERALADPDARVRTRAIDLGVQVLEPDKRVAHLLDLLAAESDPGTFRFVHQRLVQESGLGLFLEPGGEASAERRQAAVAEWRSKLAGQ